ARPGNRAEENGKVCARGPDGDQPAEHGYGGTYRASFAAHVRYRGTVAGRAPGAGQSLDVGDRSDFAHQHVLGAGVVYRASPAADGSGGRALPGRTCTTCPERQSVDAAG